VTAPQTMLIDRTAAHIRQLLAADSSGHDWWHIWRVRQNALLIGREERADLVVVQLAALLHDIADWKFHGGDLQAGPRAARHWLESQQADAPLVDAVCDIIARLSFKGAGVPDQMPSLAGRVVQDADRLDALGAIGIARTFAYGGHAGRPIYDPGIPPQLHDSPEAYRGSTAPSLNHFYEKLLLLKDRMHTPTGRRLAAERHAFLELFLRQFHQEWQAATETDEEPPR